MGTYNRNMETGKLELHFDKAEYMALTDSQKKEIKSNFLFSRYSSAWVSRAKFPNLHYAEQVAKSLGLENEGKTGEKLSFEEMQERKAERAENRADRYEEKAARAIDKGTALQAPIEKMHGDVAFFTQPNINTSAGRAFTRQRNRMWASWERGMDEFRKSDYYRDRAETARKTARQDYDVAFCQRRIDEAEKTIRAQKKNLKSYEERQEKLNNGEVLKRYSGEVITLEDVAEWIDHAEEIIEDAVSKIAYYDAIMQSKGGIKYSKADLAPGYIIKHQRYGEAEVISLGNKNAKVRFLRDNWTFAVPYTEIIAIVKATEKTAPDHPFVVGDVLTVKAWNSAKSTYEDKEYTVTKITPDKVTVKSGTERAKALRPRRMYNTPDIWLLNIEDNYQGYATKKKEVVTA